MGWNLDFYIDSAILPSSNITIKRAGVGYLFRLLALLLEEFDIEKCLKEYLKNPKIISSDVEIINGKLKLREITVESIREYLSVFVDGDLKAIPDEKLFFLIMDVLNFNMPKGDSGGSEIKNGYMLNKLVNGIICNVAFILGKDPIWVSENYNYVQCIIILKEYDKFRASKAYDMRVAVNASADDYAKYKNSLLGLKDIREV